MIDIDSMTSSEWMAYREEKIHQHLSKGNKLVPNPECQTCDVENDYVCFTCECSQLEKDYA